MAYRIYKKPIKITPNYELNTVDHIESLDEEIFVSEVSSMKTAAKVIGCNISDVRQIVNKNLYLTIGYNLTGYRVEKA